jgi:CBS domain containing-hemolysin-like protein
LFGLEIDLVLVISVVMTLAILFVSEIIPKTLGAMYWKRLGPLIAGPLNGLTWSLYPLVWLSQGLSQGLKKLFHADGTTPTLSRAEIRATADIAADEGVIDDQESHVLKNLLRFGSLQAKDIMTPRTVVVGFSEETTVAEFMETDLHLRHSRFPIYEETMDDVSGYVLKHDVLLSFAKDERDKPLSEVQREILVMPTFAKLTDLMEQMLARREHLAVLVGEYGGTAGIVTMEDLVETLLGMEIVDEVDVVEDMQALAREQWKVRAEKLGIDVDEVEAEESVHSKPDETTDEEGTD